MFAVGAESVPIRKLLRPERAPSERSLAPPFWQTTRTDATLKANPVPWIRNGINLVQISPLEPVVAVNSPPQAGCPARPASDSVSPRELPKLAGPSVMPSMLPFGSAMLPRHHNAAIISMPSRSHYDDPHRLFVPRSSPPKLVTGERPLVRITISGAARCLGCHAGISGF
jgi:hypothetical protein